MELRSEFPDVEALLIGYVAEVLGYPVHNEEPDSWLINPAQRIDDVPAAIVERIPGGGIGREFESTPTLEITLVAPTRNDLWDLLVRPLERALPALPQRRPLVDSLTMTQTFGVVGYANRSVRRAVGRVQLVTRPVR